MREIVLAVDFAAVHSFRCCRRTCSLFPIFPGVLKVQFSNEGPMSCYCVATDTGVGLQPLDCWEHGFESRWGHGCSTVVFVVCCVGSGLSTSWSLVQRSDTGCVCVCVCVCVSNHALSTNLKPRQHRPDVACCATEERKWRGYWHLDSFVLVYSMGVQPLLTERHIRYCRVLLGPHV